MDTKRVVAATLVTLFFASAFVAVASEGREIYVVLAAVALFLALVLIAASGKNEEDGDAWDAVPEHDYTGSHAELGGLTRDEQEKAVREVQEEAERRQNDR